MDLLTQVGTWQDLSERERVELVMRAFDTRSDNDVLRVTVSLPWHMIPPHIRELILPLLEGD
jgi:hypothetical protein